jgi:hypothetical protein
MKNNKQGLSTIVATLLIIMLTLVAVGIIWVVVRNVVGTGTQQVGIDAMCMQTDVQATKVVKDETSGSFNVTLSRTTGEDEIGGVKLVFTNAEGSTNAIRTINDTILESLSALDTITVPVNLSLEVWGGLVNITNVDVVVYFLDDSGNEQLCQTSSKHQF